MKAKTIEDMIRKEMTKQDDSSYLPSLLKTLSDTETARNEGDMDLARKLAGSMGYIVLDFPELSDSQLGQALLDYVNELGK